MTGGGVGCCASVTWYKGVRELTYSQRYRMMTENDGHHVMQIPSTMQQDSGEFTIVASNPLGTVKNTSLVHVLPPRTGVSPTTSDFEWSAAANLYSLSRNYASHLGISPRIAFQGNASGRPRAKQN